MNLKEKLKQFVDGWAQATNEQFTGHPIANIFRQEIKGDIEQLVKQKFDYFEVKASVGKGNWANVPWLSILNPEITSTTQDGIYPVYLFRADGSGFYLSLAQGTAIPNRQLGKKKAEQRANYIKRLLLTEIPELNSWGMPEIDLKATTDLGKSYEKSNISGKFYERSNIPESSELIADLQQLLDIYQRIKHIDVDSKLLNYDLNQNKPVTAQITTLAKPFLLLAGISGTGKTRFVREQAKSSGQFAETYCLTSVRPDWHEPSDLLGYISRLNGAAEYISTDVLQFIAQAWRAIADSGLTIDVQDIAGFGERLVVSGERDALTQVLPYWLCLDEMNLAPVEQYFADYLSVLETREWCWSNDHFSYASDALLKPATLNQVADNSKLRAALGFAAPEYHKLWQLICQYGLGIPFNLIVAGTVNMDETTHGFSRKVIDRALSFDFGAFFPNEYDDFFTPNCGNKRLSYPIYSHASQADLANSVDVDGAKTVAFLSAVNGVLKNTPFELAFRALNELLLAVMSSQPQDEQALNAVWDDFMMCKVLPRIEGDLDKLTRADGSAVLTELHSVLAVQLAPIWQDELALRPDLYREKIVAADARDAEKQLLISCRTKAKLKWMDDRLTRATFTSFWP